MSVRSLAVRAERLAPKNGISSGMIDYSAPGRRDHRGASAGPNTGSTQTPFATQAGSQATVYYAQGVGGLLAQQQSGTTRIDYTDPHGDLAMLANIGATPTGTLSYDPFGAQDGTDSGSVGADAQASLLGYQSQSTDPTTGLVDMGARLYDPTQGRFTTQDTQFGTPTDPATLNQYLYAQDSPLVYTDPNGERPTCNQCTRSETQQVTDDGSPATLPVRAKRASRVTT